MVSLPSGVLPLPVPAPAPTELSLLFANASKDPTGRNWDALMTSLFHNVHNTGNNMDTNMLLKMVTSSGTRNKMLSFTAVHGNRAHLYTLNTRWQDGLTVRNTLLNSKFFTLEGELIQDCGHIIEVDVIVFRFTQSVSVIPTVAAIANTLTTGQDLYKMSGTYTAGKPDIKGVKTRKICPDPHSLAEMWLLDDDRITRQRFFGLIYPTIVTKEKEAA